MMCKLGDFVGIFFPYSDLTTKKRRPVLVLLEPDLYGVSFIVGRLSILNTIHRI